MINCQNRDGIICHLVEVIGPVKTLNIFMQLSFSDTFVKVICNSIRKIMLPYDLTILLLFLYISNWTQMELILNITPTVSCATPFFQI